MEIFINIIQGQLEKIKQCNKHYVASKGDRAVKQSAIILATNICKLEKIVQEALKTLEGVGVDLDKCRQNMKH